MKYLLLHIMLSIALILSTLSISSCQKKEKNATNNTLEKNTETSEFKSTSLAPLLKKLSASPISVQAPMLSLPTLDGSETIDISQYQGSLLVLSVWRSGCHYCQEEADFLSKLGTLLKKDSTIKLLGITTDISLSDAKDFVKRYKVGSYPQLSDPNAQALASTQVLSIRGTPTTFFISPSGLVLGAQIGYREHQAKEVYKILQDIYNLTR